MNLWEIQPWIAGLINAHPTLAEKAVVAIVDDGSFLQNPTREATIRSKGLSVLVWTIESGGLRDQVKGGLITFDVYVPVLVEESPTVNRAGINMSAEEAAQHVLQAVIGKRPSAVSQIVMHAGDPPFEHVGIVNGLRTIAVNLMMQITTAPLAP